MLTQEELLQKIRCKVAEYHEYYRQGKWNKAVCLYWKIKYLAEEVELDSESIEELFRCKDKKGESFQENKGLGGKMLTQEELQQKMRHRAAEFRECYREKKYYKAMYIYSTVLTTAIEVQLDEKEKTELFGERGAGGNILKKGLFPEEQVEIVRKKCMDSDQISETRKRILMQQ